MEGDDSWPRSRYRTNVMRRVVLAAIVATGCARAVPTPQTAASRARVDTRWGQIQGLMAGITVIHAVQPIAVAFDELPWKDKYYVSITGAALYGATFVGLVRRERWALYVALIGPATGLATILTGWALGEAGVIDATIRPDVFQVAGGTLQLGAWLIAHQLLRIDPRFVTPVVTASDGARTLGFTVRY